MAIKPKRTAVVARELAPAGLRSGPKADNSKQQLKAWLDDAKKGTWTNPNDIKAQYGNASILKSRRVVFNIKGNDYRLVVAIAYRFGAVYIKFVGTHRRYDEIDANTVEME